MLNTAAIQQATAEMDSRPSEEKGSGERPPFTAHLVPSIRGRKHERECELDRKRALKGPLSRAERAAGQGQLRSGGKTCRLFEKRGIKGVITATV